MNQDRIYQLDLFRFLAAIAVVGFHYFHMGPFFGFYAEPSTTVRNVARYGYLGVQMFFVISGFVIAMSAEGKTARAFLKGRAVRLLPLFWVANLLTFAVTSTVANPALKVGPASLLGSLFMVPAVYHGVHYVDGVYWTLAFEWLFYLGIGLTIALGLYRHLPKLLLAWLAVSGAMLMLHVTSAPMRFAMMAEYAPYFVAGACFYRIRTRRAEFVDLFNLALSFMLALKWSQLHVQEYHAIYRLNENVVLTLVCLIFGAFLLLIGGKLKRFNRPAFAPLGALTYALYLTHQNLGYTVLGLHGSKVAPGWPLLAGVAGAALLLAYLLHRFVERPISKKLNPRPPAAEPTIPRWKRAPTLDEMTFD